MYAKSTLGRKELQLSKNLGKNCLNFVRDKRWAGGQGERKPNENLKGCYHCCSWFKLVYTKLLWWTFVLVLKARFCFAVEIHHPRAKLTSALLYIFSRVQYGDAQKHSSPPPAFHHFHRCFSAIYSLNLMIFLSGKTQWGEKLLDAKDQLAEGVALVCTPGFSYIKKLINHGALQKHCAVLLERTENDKCVGNYDNEYSFISHTYPWVIMFITFKMCTMISKSKLVMKHRVTVGGFK